jgi:hypothetical protein
MRAFEMSLKHTDTIEME